MNSAAPFPTGSRNVLRSSPMDGHVLRLTLNAPKANVIDRAMVASLSAALREDVSASTRLIVFEGAGDHFSFGASVPEHQADTVATLLEEFHGLFRQLAEVSVPTCAVIRGQCLGGGLELASWCTWMVATPDARLGQPEIQLAVFPPMASLLLPWRAGGRAALDLCVSGRSVTADEALALGVINVVTDEPDAWWQKLVERRLSPMSAAALRHAERAARRDIVGKLRDELPALETQFIDELMKTHDANEGITAFMERRRPIYLDR